MPTLLNTLQKIESKKKLAIEKRISEKARQLAMKYGTESPIMALNIPDGKTNMIILLNTAQPSFKLSMLNHFRSDQVGFDSELQILVNTKVVFKEIRFTDPEEPGIAFSDILTYISDPNFKWEDKLELCHLLEINNFKIDFNNLGVSKVGLEKLIESFSDGCNLIPDINKVYPPKYTFSSIPRTVTLSYDGMMAVIAYKSQLSNDMLSPIYQKPFHAVYNNRGYSIGSEESGLFLNFKLTEENAFVATVKYCGEVVWLSTGCIDNYFQVSNQHIEVFNANDKWEILLRQLFEFYFDMPIDKPVDMSL